MSEFRENIFPPIGTVNSQPDEFTQHELLGLNSDERSIVMYERDILFYKQRMTNKAQKIAKLESTIEDLRIGLGSLERLKKDKIHLVLTYWLCTVFMAFGSLLASGISWNLFKFIEPENRFAVGCTLMLISCLTSFSNGVIAEVIWNFFKCKQK